MPRDARLYMTFPNDFHRHPKITRLPVEVRWAFVEMNGEARIADNDGIFDAADAEFTWGADTIAALIASHPSRPLLQRVGDTVIIRDYAEHQQTRAEREELRAKRAEAGRAGGKAKASNRLASANQVPGEVQQTEAESESESTDFFSPSKSQSRDTRASLSTDAMDVPEMTRRMAQQKGITSLRVVADAIQKQTGLRVDASGAYQVAVSLLDRAKKWPTNPQRYVLICLGNTPLEVQQFIHEHALEVAS